MNRAKKKKSGLCKGLCKVFLASAMTFGLVAPAGKPLQAKNSFVAAIQPAAYGQDDYTSPTHGLPHRSRGLTAGETALARSLFGAELDMAGMRFQFYPAENDGTSALIQANETRNVEFYGHRYLPDDFSREMGKRGSDSHYNYGNFVALMTGALQLQQWSSWRYKAGAEGYDYALDKDKSFADYGLGQQMSIMTDYALRFLHPDHAPHLRDKEKPVRTAEEDRQLKRIVEDRFPEAKKTREARWETYARSLTAGEKALARAIFADDIDTENLRLHLQPEDLKDVAASAPDGSRAHFWGADDHSADYSLEKDNRLFGNFVHELLHIWQWQKNWSHTPDMTDGVYKYQLTAESKFKDFSIEQQAAIVEDYARYYLHADRNTYWLQQSYPAAKDRHAMIPLLRQLVETQFPATKAAREDFEAKKTEKRTPVARLLSSVFG